MTNIDIPSKNYELNHEAHGYIKIWNVDQATGKNELIVEHNNLIVKQGADILAAALAGKPNSGITHFYIGYNTDSGFSGGPAITTSDNTGSFSTSGNYGYIRIPLAFPASYLNEATYTGNMVYFTTFLTNGGAFTEHGATFANGVKLYCLGLVNGSNPSNDTGDNLFSKVNFGPITYNSANGLAITWGITFRAI